MPSPEPDDRPADEPPPPDLDRAESAPTLPTRNLTGVALGDFLVERLLGHGGMGEVYLARQISLNREVAIKVLRPDLLNNPTYLKRFEAEAWAAAKLNHPNIVHIYAHCAVGDVRFIAMEYVQGTNLRAYINKKGPPELPLALSILRQAGLAIGAAGEIGLIHRDIKPENLLLTRRGQIKVADFGLCRDQGPERLHLTQPGVTMGTPMYMSPEQVQGRPLDHRSDLYSLGVTSYHMLAGVPPFRAETALALAFKHVNEEPVSLAVHRPDIPPELVAMVMKLMAKQPSERYQSTGEMLRDLAKIKESVRQSGSSLDSLPMTVSRMEMPSGDIPTIAPEKKWRPGPWRWPSGSLKVGGPTVAVVLAFAGLAGAAVGWTQRANDLLGAGSTAGAGAPGLRIADWKGVARQANPEAQYRFAQIAAPSAAIEAAWLAVPGYFPSSRDWSEKAYVQLVRALFKHRDADRLEILAQELGSDGRGQPTEQDKTLAEVARAAALALKHDGRQAITKLKRQQDSVLDTALALVCLEIALVLDTDTTISPAERVQLREFQARLRDVLLINFTDVPNG